MPVKTYTEFAAENQQPDPLESIKAYADYARLELAKTGELTDEVNNDLTQSAFRKAVEVSAIPTPADEEQANSLFSEFRKRPPSRDNLQLAARALEDSGDKTGAESVRAYWAVQDPKVKSQYPDEATFNEALANAKAAADPYIADESMAKRYAVGSGLARFASYEDANGQIRVLGDSNLSQLSDEELSSYAAANPQYVNPEHLPAVKRRFTKIEGFDITPAAVERKAEVAQQLAALANSDPNFADAITGVTTKFTDDERSTGQRAVDATFALPTVAVAGLTGLVDYLRTGKVAKNAPMARSAAEAIDSIGDAGLLQRYSKDELIAGINDMAIRRGVDDLTFDESQPASVVKSLSDGTLAMPVRVLANKRLFDSTLEKLVATDAQKSLLKRERGDKLDAYAKLILPQLIEADGSILDEVNKLKAGGADDGDVLESITANRKYNGVTNRLENFGLALTKTVTDLIPAVGAVLPDFIGDPIKEAGYGISKKINSEQAANNALAAAFGKDFGWVQTLTEQVPQLAADILVSRGAGRAAGAVGRVGARASSILAPELTAKLARFSATRLPSVVGKEVGADIASRLSTIPNEIGWLASQGARTFGSTYVSTRSALEAQVDEAGRPKFTPEQIDNVATETAVQNALVSNAITLGFNHIAGGQFAGSETLAAGRGFSTRNLKSFYDDLQAGVRQLPADLRNEIKLTDFNTFVKDSVKASLKPYTRVVFGAAGEGAEEFAQNVAQDVITNNSLDKDFDLRESTRAAALAASFGAALGGASTGISELETRYLREPAYQQADFEESYLKRSIDQLRKANSPATADFLESQLSLAQSKKQTIRQRFTEQAASEQSLADSINEAAQREANLPAAPTPEARPNSNLLPAPTENELTPAQNAELNRLNKHKARLERILTEASSTPEPTEAQIARIAELQSHLERVIVNIENVPSTIALAGEAGPEPERINFPVSPLPAYDPVTGVTITGAAIEREGQFEMPFMADWVSLESKPAELADEDNVIEASINDAQLEFGIEPAAIEIESKDKVLSDISASVPVAKLVTFNKNATPELRTEFQNTVAMAESTHDDITRYSKERELLAQRIPAFEANIESLIARTPTLASEQTLASYRQRLASANARVAEIDSELESLRADRSGLTARIKQLASKPADDIADVVGRILENVEAAPEAAAKEITKKTSRKKAAGERPSKATSVAKDIDVAATEAAIEAIEMAEETSTPAETLAVAVEAAQKKQSKRKAKAAAPASVSENAQIAEAITEADVGATETQLTADEIRDSAIQMLVDAGIMSREAGLEAVKEKLKKKLAATKFTAEDALPLVDMSETVDYKIKSGTKTTGKYLKSFSKPTDFLTTEDFEKFNSYLAAGTYPKSIVLQKQELASGSQAYVIPFFNTIEREIANRYPTIPAPEVAVDPTLSQDQIYNPITGVTVFRSGLSEQRLINARKSIRFEIKRLIDKRWQSPKQVEEWNAAVQKAKSELAAISIRLQNVDSAAHAKAALERESLREWLKQTVPDKASKLKRDIWENDAAPVRARLSELDDIISGLETETPILAEFAAKTDELARLNNDKAFTEKEWVAKIKVAKDALLQLNQRIADYAKTGDLIIERKTERAARMKDEIDTTLRKKIGGELERVHLPVEQREDGTYIGAHTNVPEDAARLLDHGFSIFVAPKLRKKKNPAIKLDKNGFVKSVTLADGRVIKSAGDMRSLIEDSYVAEESGEDHMKFAFNLPAVTPAVAPLIGKDTAGFNDEKFVTAAFAYLRDAKSSKLRDIRGQLLAADESYDEFANAVLTRHLRTIREFSLAVRIRQTVNRGRSVDKLMQRLFVVDGQIQPDIRRMLVSKYGENSDKMLLYTYASQLNNELGESFTPEVGDEDVPVADASEGALLTPEESGKISRRWINGRPAALDTQVNNVWTNFSKALSRREVVWHSELPNENVLEDAMTSPQMEEAVGDIIGGMEAAFITSAENFDYAAEAREQINFKATGDVEQDMDQLDAVIKRTYDALNDSTIRAAFEEVAKAFGVTNIKRKSNKELVELLRDETSATAEKARVATQKLVAKEVNKLVKAELKKNKALDPDKVRERLTREVERNIAQERAASVDVESARIVKSYITPLAEFSKAIKDTAADIERNKAIRETRKWEQQTYGRAGLSSETVALIEGTKQYKAQPIETPVITPEQTLERVSAVTLPDGTVWSRAQLRDIAEKMRTVSESDQYTEDKRSQYGKFADKIEETLAGTKKRNITVGRDIFFAKAKNTPTDIARIIRENSVEIALLEIQSGDTASMIAALDKVSGIHKDVAALLKTRADILANVSIEFVTMPNSGWAGQYAADSNTIYINRAATNGISVESTLLHEMLHAVTAYSINNPDTAAAKMLLAKLESLRSKALEAAVGNGETDLQFLAGLSDVHEFVSYMMTSPDFQRKLLEVDGRNFVRRFIDSIISFFTGRRNPATVNTIRDIVELVGMSNARPYGTKLSEDVAASVEPAVVTETPAVEPAPAAEPVDVVYDATLPAAFSSRSDSDSVFINPDLLAEMTSGLSERAAANVTRSLVSHELAHIAAFKTLTEQDVNDIAATLDDSKLVAVADKYYSATIEDSEQRLQQIKLDRAAGKLTDRDLAHEFIRMHAEKALSGFTSEETASFWRSNPNLVSRFARYLRAFINKLTQRITSVNDSRTAASLNRVTRALAELEAGNVVESVDDAISKATSGDVTFAYAMPVSSGPEYDSRPYWKKLLQSEATPAVKALLDEKSAYAKMTARIAERYTLQMAKHKKAGLITDADSELVRAASGGHVKISRAAQRALNERYDKSLALIESKFNASEQKKADIVQREAEKIQLDRELEKWTDAEWQKADNEVRSQMAKALDMLPEPVRKTISDMRAAIDVESGKLANDPHLPDDLRASISSNVGIYLTQTYRAFTQTGWNKMLKAGGVAVIGNETVDFTAIKENALKYFAERANETLTARYEKDGLTPSALKAKVNAGVTLEAQRMFDEFIARYEDNAAGLALANASPEAVRKALLTGEASDPVAYKAAADSLKYGQNKYLERKELPEFLRQLLGEVTDPVEATLRTFTTVAMLASNQQFLADLKATGVAGGWMTHGPTTEHPEYEKLASESSPATVSILAGMYGPKEFKQLLDGMFLKSPQAYEDTAQSLVSSTTGLLRAAAGKAMAAKTLLSVGYYSRNALSDWLFFAPFQGILIDVANKRRWKTAANSSFAGMDTARESSVAGYDTTEDYIQDLIRLGVLDNDASTTALKQTIGGLTTNPEETLRKLGSSVEDINNSGKVASAISASVGGFNTVLEKAAKVSNTIGAHLKIAVYEHELATLREAYGSERSDEQMKKEAARKVGLTTQTRSNLAPVVQRFTQSGLGSIVAPFLAFKSEVFRITASTMKLAKEEITSGNDIIAARGKRRLAGMITTTFVLPSLLAGVTHLIFGAAFGDDDDDVLSANAVRDYFLPRSFEEIRRDKALRAGLPEWQQNNSVTFAVTGDKARSLDMTFVNPFALVTDPLWRSFEHVVNGDEDKIAETFARWAGETIIGEQIAAGAITDAFNNRDDRGMTIAGEDLPFHERLLKQTLYVADKGFKPPVASFIYNEITGERGSAKPNSVEARNANRLELLAGEAFGVRPRALDLEVLAETAMRREAGKLRGVRSAASVATSQYPLAAGEVAASVERINNARVARAQQTRMLMEEFGKFVDTGRLISIGREAGMSKDSIKKAVAGYADRFEMRREDLMAVYKAGEEASGTGQQRLTELVTAIQKSPKLLPVK